MIGFKHCFDILDSIGKLESSLVSLGWLKSRFWERVLHFKPVFSPFMHKGGFSEGHYSSRR